MDIYNEIKKNKYYIAGEIISICKANDISVIMPLAKKGKLMLDLLGIKTRIKKENINIISDRELNKKGNYEKYNKSILLFDDSIKTGARLKHTKNYLEKKIIDALINKNKSEQFKTNFYYYALVKCKDIAMIDDFEEKKLFCYKRDRTISEYYKFCIDESYDFQKKLFSTSIDLPLFSLRVNDIEQFKSILKQNKYFQFNDTFSNIAYKKISLGVLLIDIPNYLEALKGFAIALSAKIRYEKQQDSSYKIIFNPFVICDSIKYNELEKLYNILFDEEKQTESKFDMNLLFVKLYREVVYLLSYSVGIYIKEFLEKYSYEVKYENKSKNSYLENFDSKYESRDFAEIYKIICHKLNEFSYTKISNNDDIDNNVYSQNQTLISLYDAITTDSQKKQISEYNYNFVEMKDISFLHTTDNLMNFITSMYQLIENYTISQEIEFNFANSRIERGFVNGENGDVILPVERPEVFIKVLLNYYKRTNRNFDIYMENYDLFITN